MGFVLGRKPEHETLCFSVWSGCRWRWKVPRLCGGCGWGRLDASNWFLLCGLQRVAVPVCVVLCVSWICGCRSHWIGCMIAVIWCCHVRRCMRGSRVATSCCKTHCYECMNVAWALFWGGSRSTKPCIFPCKVAAAGDERYLVCAAVAVWIVSRSIGSSFVFCNEWLFLCA